MLEHCINVTLSNCRFAFKPCQFWKVTIFFTRLVTWQIGDVQCWQNLAFFNPVGNMFELSISVRIRFKPYVSVSYVYTFTYICNHYRYICNRFHISILNIFRYGKEKKVVWRKFSILGWWSACTNCSYSSIQQALQAVLLAIQFNNSSQPDPKWVIL